ncbi:ATP-binding protein [Methylotenera versatilis]|uniref:histidine kinase n=1 Tax=Methylotenera versatilis (strain 301) TaxID=666681 RepID=D7DJG4_METV0|nr:ATP-binding protein [Methylotenera versatilis]ADI30199.1 integral membrane sensor signal transduction histidine kinase [Methylotenera versatilis 301]
MKSIRQSLLLWLTFGMLAATCLAGISAYLLALDEANELFDYQIKQVALSLDGQSQASPVVADDDPDEDNVIQIWDALGKPLFTSYPSRALPRYLSSGFQTVNFRQRPWRIYNAQLQGKFIQVAQPMIVRDELAANLAERILIPFFVLIPFFAILIWWVVRRSLNPLESVTNAIAARHADAMQTLDETALPQEVRPIVVALNQLLIRLNQAMKAQHAFIADAAHELRTPLTALKLQLQLTERATSDVIREVGFVKLNERLDRSIHLVKQLLTLARSESKMQSQQFGPVDLSYLAREVTNDFTPLAKAAHTDLQLDIDPNIIVSGQQGNLRILINNLVDNALCYTPNFGQVCISVKREAPHVVLRVIDNGSGIPEQERERVLDRFYRREGTEVTGSGLGLAIVRNIAEAHYAKLILSDNLNTSGLVVTVKFPF